MSTRSIAFYLAGAPFALVFLVWLLYAPRTSLPTVSYTAPPPAPAVTPAPSPPLPPAATTVPARYPGQWIGTVTQPGFEPYPIAINFTGGTGTVDYSVQPCGGTLELQEERTEVILYRETISYGRDKCMNDTIRITRADANALDLTWYDDSGRTVAHALVRHPAK